MKFLLLTLKIIFDFTAFFQIDKLHRNCCVFISLVCGAKYSRGEYISFVDHDIHIKTETRFHDGNWKRKDVCAVLRLFSEQFRGVD